MTDTLTDPVSRAVAVSTARLEQEIRNQQAALASGLAARQCHPSYGYTKAGLRRDLHRLEGMLAAWMLVTGRWTLGGAVLDDSLRDTVKTALDIDLERLRIRVDSC